MIFAAVPAILGLTMALCADDRFKIRSTELEQHRMALSLLMTSFFCGWNLQMHDLGFIVWTVGKRIEFVHLLLRMSEVIVRVSSYGLLIASMSAITSGRRRAG